MRAARAPVAALLAATFALSGCLTSGGDGDAGGLVPPKAADLLPYLRDADGDHEHGNVSQHEASWNFRLLGHHALSEDPVARPAHINQIVARDGFVYVSAYAVPPSMQPGLIILNATDPHHPTVAGVFTKDDVVPIDIFLSDDGRYAFLAGHRFTPEGRDVTPTTPLPGNCQGTGLPKYEQVCGPWLGFGVYAVNVEDPYHPRFAGQFVTPMSGAHTVKYGRITDGPGAGEYLFLADYGFRWADRLATAVETLRIEPGAERVSNPAGGSAPGTDELVFALVSRHILPPTPVDGLTFVHDTWFARHPVTDQSLLYVAHWDGGVHILDVSVPAAPRAVGVWNDFDSNEYGNIHSVITAPQMVEDVYFMVVSPEYGQAPHAGKVWTVDITDPARPATMGEFTVPGDPLSNVTGAYLYSPHNVDIADGVAYHGHNHAGVWALDISTKANLTEPKAVGVHFPTPPDGRAPEGVGVLPAVWNVWMDQGLAFASERYTGVYILELEARHPGDPPWAGLSLD